MGRGLVLRVMKILLMALVLPVGALALPLAAHSVPQSSCGCEASLDNELASGADVTVPISPRSGFLSAGKLTVENHGELSGRCSKGKDSPCEDSKPCMMDLSASVVFDRIGNDVAPAKLLVKGKTFPMQNQPDDPNHFELESNVVRLEMPCDSSNNLRVQILDASWQVMSEGVITARCINCD